MRKLIFIGLVLLILTGCVSNKAFKAQEDRVALLERSLEQNSTELVVLRKEIMQDRKLNNAAWVKVDSLYYQVNTMNEDLAILMEDLGQLEEDTYDTMEGFADRFAQLTTDYSNMATKDELRQVILENTELARSVTQLTNDVETSHNALKVMITDLEAKLAGLKTTTGTDGTVQYSGDVESLRKRVDELAAKVNEFNNSTRADIETLRSRLDSRAEQPLKPSPTKPQGTMKDEYEAARAEYGKGRFETSRQMFRDFLSKYPDSDYAGNAVYWTGENYYAEGDFTTALQQFQTVLSRYPDSWKNADSQLKIGLCYWHMGNVEAGRQEMEAVKTQYPQYNRLDLVEKFLKQMK